MSYIKNAAAAAARQRKREEGLESDSDSGDEDDVFDPLADSLDEDLDADESAPADSPADDYDPEKHGFELSTEGPHPLGFHAEVMRQALRQARAESAHQGGKSAGDDSADDDSGDVFDVMAGVGEQSDSKGHESEDSEDEIYFDEVGCIYKPLRDPQTLDRAMDLMGIVYGKVVPHREVTNVFSTEGAGWGGSEWGADEAQGVGGLNMGCCTAFWAVDM